MEIKQLDLRRQYNQIKTEVDKAILGVCESGMFCLGENVKKFEEEAAKYIGTKYGIGVNSGSASLNLALEALNIGPEDEVLVPANTYIATVFAISHVGATPVFVDCNTNYTIDVEQAKQKLTKKTKAVIAVHLYGQACDMDELVDFTAANGLFLIEDCAQAFGATYKGKKVGSFGHVGCLSCYPGKNLGAYGDGGIIFTNIKMIEERLRILRNDGQPKKYNHSYIGYNERLDEIQAAVLRVKLKYIDNWNLERNNIATIYSQLITEKRMAIILPAIAPERNHVWHQFVIRIPTFENRSGVIMGNTRNKIRKILWEDYKIGTGIHYPIPCHKQECYKEYNNLSMLNTEHYAKELLSLPMFPELSYKEIKIVVEKLAEALNKARKE